MAAQIKNPSKAEMHKHMWEQVQTLVIEYGLKNHLGWLTVWGMLADKVDEGVGSLYDEVLTNHLSLYDAVQKLELVNLLMDTAREMFVKFDDDRDIPC